MRIGSMCALGAALLALSCAGPSFGEPPAPAPPTPPTPRAIPGVTAADPFPNGCVDCHLDYVDRKMDVRISTLMKKYAEGVPQALLAKAQAAAPEGLRLAGRHPATGDTKSVPASCLGCHAKSAKKAPPFGRLLHVIHLAGAEQNHYMTLFQGECTHCHKLNSKTGAWTIPSASER